MILSGTKFLPLVCQGSIPAPLKSYSDSLLFYYLGHLASISTPGALSEIGLGGSTYPLLELAETNAKSLYVFDKSQASIDQCTSQTQYWPNTDAHFIATDSADIARSYNDREFCYCHIDGSKHYEITLSDLEFYLDHLSPNGLICQDDYGNNKWPTVTDAVKALEMRYQLSIVLIGDSSCWLTRPEYYDHWMNLLARDQEFNLLRVFCNVADSVFLGRNPRYFFLHSGFNRATSDQFTEVEHGYFQNLLKSYCEKYYLKMPYPSQSKPGMFLTKNEPVYKLTVAYDEIRGQDWPLNAPRSKTDIDLLPQWVKEEIRTIHGIDPYEHQSKDR